MRPNLFLAIPLVFVTFFGIYQARRIAIRDNARLNLLIENWKAFEDSHNSHTPAAMRGPAQASCESLPVPSVEIRERFRKITGYTLQERKPIPGFDTQGQEELTTWNQRELLSFDLASPLLAPSLLRLPTLKNFYRFPRGYKPTSMDSTTAAFATSRDGIGFIAYLGIQGDELEHWGDLGNFMRMVIVHEIAHRGDNHWSGGGNLTSETNEWLKLSGWTLKEYREGKELKRKWEFSAPNFIRTYAETDPGEDFAESVAAYQWQIPALKNLSKAKVDYVKDKIFKNQTPASDPIYKFALDSLYEKLSPQLAKFLQDCGGADEDFVCVGKKIMEAIPAILDQVATQSASACFVVEANRKGILQEATLWGVQPFMNKLGIRFDQFGFKSEFELYTHTIESIKQVDPKKLFLDSLGYPSPKDQFEQTLRQSVSWIKYKHFRNGEEVDIQLSWHQTELQKFLERNSFENLQASYNEFLNHQVELMDADYRNVAQAQVKECLEKGASQRRDSVRLEPFDFGADYLDAGCLNLINTEGIYRVNSLAAQLSKSEAWGGHLDLVTAIRVSEARFHEHLSEELRSEAQRLALVSGSIFRDIEVSSESGNSEKCRSSVEKALRKKLLAPITGKIRPEYYQHLMFISIGDLVAKAQAQKCDTNSQ